MVISLKTTLFRYQIISNIYQVSKILQKAVSLVPCYLQFKTFVSTSTNSTIIRYVPQSTVSIFNI